MSTYSSLPFLTIPLPMRPVLGLVALALSLGTPGPSASAADYCNSAGVWDLGGGLTAENWRDSGLNGWFCNKIYSSHSFAFNWGISTYGFMTRVYQKEIWKPIDSCNQGAWAYHDHAMQNWGSGGAYTGFYGWFYEPNIEWYIVEDWFGNYPLNSQKKGTYVIDGATYDIYNIKGGSYGSWDQWWSIRQTKRTKGTISYVKHWLKWRNLGCPNAKVNGAGFFVEPLWGAATSGQVDYNYADMVRP